MTGEGYARRFRSELKLSGWPQARHAWQIAAGLAHEILVEVNPVLRPYSLPREGGKTIITIPAAWDEHRQMLALLEEIGHHLLCSQTPMHLISDRVKDRRLLYLWEGREENRARGFVLAWLLPADLVIHYDDLTQLARDAGCSLEMAQERWRMLFAEAS